MTAFVYEFLDTNGDHLYVGCSTRLGSRINQHLLHQPWWDQVVEIRAHVYPDLEAGLEAEAALIRQTQPKHNMVHTDKRPKKRQPCKRCMRSHHKHCLGVNRFQDPCPCGVCARSREGVTANTSIYWADRRVTP